MGLAFSQKPRWFPVVSGTEIWGWGHHVALRISLHSEEGTSGRGVKSIWREG